MQYFCSSVRIYKEMNLDLPALRESLGDAVLLAVKTEK